MDSLLRGNGKMDFAACQSKKLAKKVKVDENLIESLLKSSSKKLNAQKLLQLDDNTATSKITLVYDALRELLEALSISKGYKIYNHECYASFLKEIVNESNFGDIFNNFRKIRNDINYYGKDVSADEAKPVIDGMADFIESLKARFFANKNSKI